LNTTGNLETLTEKEGRKTLGFPGLDSLRDQILIGAVYYFGKRASKCSKRSSRYSNSTAWKLDLRISFAAATRELGAALLSLQISAGLLQSKYGPVD